MLKKKKKLLVLLSVFMGVAVFLVSMEVYEKGIVKGCLNRWFFKPEILAKYEFIDLDTCRDPETFKKKLFLACNDRRGNSYCKETGWTMEGDPIIYYYIVEEGQLTLVRDATKDEYGPRVFTVWRNMGLKLSYRKDGKTVYWNENDSSEKQLQISTCVLVKK
ncbi:MAG: hypothetical protein JEZ07_12415 [Phycisphaerae bacterium]|nr:hypothetical protein [Phycisphaerae bacterium]